MIRAVLSGLALGALGAVLWLLPPGEAVERDTGLAVLFRLRGERPAPPGVAVVAIDRASSRAFGFGTRPSEWSRRAHADLLRHLARAGASAVVFDIVFAGPREAAGDAELAAAIGDAGNVVLAEALRRDWVDGGSGAPTRISEERLVGPQPAMAAAALDLAPFPLPKDAPTIDRWQWYRASAGDVATLPAVALAASLGPDYARFSEVWGRERLPALPPWRSGTGMLQGLLQSLRDALRADPALGGRLIAGMGRPPAATDRGRRVVAALVALAGSGPDRLIDYYGPPRTVPTWSFHRALAPESAAAFAGSVVFVGYSADAQSDQDAVRDNYPTVFPGTDGLEQSGVEIAAAAFANLLEPRSLRGLTPEWGCAALVLWGVACVLAVRWSSAGRGWVLVSALGVAWAAVALVAFSKARLWLPLVVPEAQVLLAAVTGLAVRYGMVRRAIGYFVPDAVAERMSRASGRPEVGRKRTAGVILVSDAEHYTRVSEKLTPDRLRALLGAYQSVLATAVEGAGGAVVDWAGDGMLAMWEASPGAAAAAGAGDACRAALAMVAATASPLEGGAGPLLPTRIGLHAGAVMTDLIGGGRRYAYRPIGDVVNTAARLQELNKELGTRVLASGDCAGALSGFELRFLGPFELRGKAERVDVYEVLGEIGAGDGGSSALRERFSCALSLFSSGEVSQALTHLETIALEFPNDGPTRFFIARCLERLARTS